MTPSMPKMNRFLARRLALQIAISAMALVLTSCQTANRRSELQQQRYAIQLRLAQSSEAEDEDASKLVALDRMLGERSHSVEFYDTLSSDNPARIFLARQLVREFVASRRYSDAVLGWDERYVNQLLNSKDWAAARVDLGSNGGPHQLMRQLADFYEALVGAGDLPNAQALAARIYDLDSASEVLDMLKDRAARAGRPGLPAIKTNRARAVVVIKPVSTLTRFKNEMAIPVSRAEIAAQAKVKLDTFYGLLFQELDLPPDRLDRLKNLLVQRQTEVFDSGNAARDRGKTPQNDRDSFRAELQQGVQAADARIAALLGPDLYRQYVDYNSALPRWFTANQLADSLRSTPTPLTAPQARRLVEALADSEISNPAPGPLSIAAGSGQFPAPFPTRPDTRVREEAAGFLSPPQMAALHRVAQRQEIEWDATTRVEPEDSALANGG
jgi:hypothetical protein